MGNPNIRPYTKIYEDIQERGWLYYFTAFPIMLIMHDTYFYWTHRIMHHKLLFNSFHLVHHKSTNPSPWAAYAFHPLEAVVENGTARRARIEGIEVCGKTGTVENPHGADHSVFFGFAPKENPKIVVSVFIENAGFGGTWAAPITKLLMEKYLLNKVNAEVEKYILDKHFY